MTKHMNKIEKLIAELCPEGVGYKDLGEVAEFKYGFTDRAKDEGNVRFIRITDIDENGKLRCNDSKFLNLKEENKNYLLLQGDILMARTGATYGKTMLFNENYQAVYASFLIRIRFKENNIFPSYYWHFAQSRLYWDQANKLVGGGAQPQFNANVLKKIKIPIPPLHIQQEIIKILDTFSTLETKLKAELEAELEARKKQYEYYRDELLTFGDDACLPDRQVQWRELGEVTYYPKNRISSAIVDNTNYVGVDNLLQNKQGKTDSNYVPTTGNLIEYRINDVLIGNIRPYLKKIWLSTNNGGTNGDVVVIRINDENKKELIPRYLYFLLSSDKFFDYDMRFAKGAKMPRGNKDAILKYNIPIPPLAEQQRIVAILDKFDALVNDISVGLPAEINARRNQYEYYRNKLLTFKPLEKDHAG